jgi:plasmid maintenance system antidote protein VapI
MESVLSNEVVTFEVLQARLLALVNARIHNGEYTERGLARVLGISQSQLHNVLKGARQLHHMLADRLLIKFGITALDLLCEHEMEEGLRGRRTATNIQYAVGFISRKPAGRSESITPRRAERTRFTERS